MTHGVHRKKNIAMDNGKKLKDCKGKEEKRKRTREKL
jgi:hypothetical protein